ncbi:MAG TPA: phospholipase [Devosia sp.]|nr:phospholipase [Devosia sp.]
MTVTLSGPMLPPRSGGAARQVMVLLHGYGADGADLIGLGAQWRDAWPDMLFVAPNAPWACARNPAGYEWFALGDRPVEDFRREGADRVRPVIVNFLIDLWSQTGLSARDTVLCGFSQGAMMALHVGLALDRPVRGVIAFSGALIPPPPPWSKPPVALIHGDLDSVVPVALCDEAERILRAEGIEVRRHIEQSMGHGIAPDGLGFATGFLHSLMPVSG